MTRFTTIIVALWCALTMSLIATTVTLPARADVPASTVDSNACLNAMDYIPANLKPAIRARTGTTDVATYLQAAFQAACDKSTAGAPAKVCLESGRYPVGAAGLHAPCSMFELYGPVSTLGNMATLLALSDMTTGNHGAMLAFEKPIIATTIANLELNSNNKKADGLFLQATRNVRLERLKIGGVNSGHTRAPIVSSSAAADTFTISTAHTNDFPVGTPVEFYIRGANAGSMVGGLSASTVKTTTPYYVVSSAVGGVKQVSTTPSGAPVDIGSACSAFECGVRRGSFTLSTMDDTADTLTIGSAGTPLQTNPFVEGQRVEFQYLNANASVVAIGDHCLQWDSDDGAPVTPFGISGRGLYVRNPTSNPATIQVAWEIGGTPLDLTPQPDIADCRVTASYAGIRGGGITYMNAEYLYVGSMPQARGMTLTINEQDIPGSINYYGLAVASTVEKSIFYTGIRLGGLALEVANNSFEGGYSLPNICMLELSDPLNAVKVAVRNNYWEIGETERTMCNIYAGGGRIVNNFITGHSADEEESYGIVGPGSSTAGELEIIDNRISEVHKPWTLNQSVGHALTSPELFVYKNNHIRPDSPDNTPAGAVIAVNATATTAPRPVDYYEYNTGVHWLQGQVQLGLSTVTDPTALGVHYGNFLFPTVSSGSTITSSVNPRAGRSVWIKPNTDGLVLGTGAVTTSTGANLPLCGGGAVFVAGNGSNVMTAMNPMGSTVECRKLTERSGDIGTANLFSGNVTAGLFEVCAYQTVTTAGSAGTQDLTIGWNDGTAARSKVLVDDQALDSTSYGEGCVRVRTNGSSNITYATAQTGASGSPVYSLSVNVRHLQ